MINGLNRLRHNGIIGSNNQNHNIGNLRAARSHRGKGCVTGRVEKTQHSAPCGLDLIGTYMLRDAPSFASDDLGVSNRIQ